MIQFAINPQSEKSYIQQIQDQIRLRIRTGEWKPGDKLPPLRTISAQCGVSLGVVQQAVGTLCTEGYLRARTGSGTFVSETNSVRNKSIAVVVPSLEEHILNLLRGIKQVFRGQYRLNITAADYDFDQESDLLHSLDTVHVAGAIIYPPPVSLYRGALEELNMRGMTYVLVDTTLPGLNADAVLTDNGQMGYMAMSTLLKHGHRRIGFIDLASDALHIRQRHIGINKALGEFDLTWDNLSCVRVSSTDLNENEPWANGCQAAKHLLNEHPDLTAILAGNAWQALGSLRAVREFGKSVPGDISLISLGDMSLFYASDPPMTAIAQPHEAIGARAAKNLLARLNGTFLPPGNILLAPTINERSSIKSLS
jgi:LacI family transcriptional regulator